MLPRPAAKPEASGSSRGPAQRAADRAVLVHPVRHHGEHLGRLVVAGRQLDVVRLTDLYAEVAAAAPNALIVATGYPLLFELVRGGSDLVLKAQINDATTRLNCAIEKAVAAARQAAETEAEPGQAPA